MKRLVKSRTKNGTSCRADHLTIFVSDFLLYSSLSEVARQKLAYFWAQKLRCVRCQLFRRKHERVKWQCLTRNYNICHLHKHMRCTCHVMTQHTTYYGSTWVAMSGICISFVDCATICHMSGSRRNAQAHVTTHASHGMQNEKKKRYNAI